jgi:hypothetical protein
MSGTNGPAEPRSRARRTTRRRLSPTAVIAAVLPVLTIGALLLVRPDLPADRAQAPVSQTLHSALRACPADPAPVLVSAREPGSVSVSGTDVAVRPHTPSSAGRSEKAALVVGTGPQATGLLAGRWRARGLAALTCPDTATTTWFTGVGAGATHSSTISLTNPDRGSAVADITVLAKRGPKNVPALRGITVPGDSTTVIDLSEVFPRRPQLAVRVEVPRGRLSASVLDVNPALGPDPETSDWLPGQAAPATDQLLLGLAPGGSRDDRLVLANTSENEGHAQVRVVTKDASFAPENLPQVSLPPQSVTTVRLEGVLRSALKDGAIGLEIRSSVPTTATLRSVVDGDLVHTGPVTPDDQTMTSFVPPGAARVLIGQASAIGTVEVRSYSHGKRVGATTVETTPGTGGVIELPRGTDFIEVVPERAAVNVALSVSGRPGASTGAVVLPLAPPVTGRLVPSVRPGR